MEPAKHALRLDIPCVVMGEDHCTSLLLHAAGPPIYTYTRQLLHNSSKTQCQFVTMLRWHCLIIILVY